MKNILRWALCQTFGKSKGVILFDHLMDGPLGEQIRHADESALGALLDHAASAIKMAERTGR